MPDIARRMWSALRSAVTATPLEVLTAIVAALSISMAIENAVDSEVLARIAVLCGLLIPVAFAGSSSAALKVFDGRTRWVLTAVFGAAAAAYSAFGFDPAVTTEWWRAGFLIFGAFSLITIVPLAARLGDTTASERFWRFNAVLGARVLVAAFYSLSLFAGVCAGLLAIDALFDVSIDDELIGHLFAWLVVGLGTVLAVAGLRDAARINRDFSNDTRLWLARLGTWLFIPLLFLYLAIMYAYLALVVTGGEVPSNVLSPLALGAGLIGYFGLFVLHPVRHTDGYKPLNFILKVFPAAFIPIVPLGIWAVAERVQQYGWTEFRYARVAALVCLGLFSIVGTYKWLRGRDFSLLSGPAIIASVALLGAVGPWSASHISLKSQQVRFVQKAQSLGLMDGEMLAPMDELKASGGWELSDAAEYLLEVHGPESLDHLTAAELASVDTVYEQMALLGVDYIPPTRHRVFALADRGLFHVPAGKMFEFYTSASPQYIDGSTTVSLEGPALVVTHAGHELEASLASLSGSDSEDYQQRSREQMTFSLRDRHTGQTAGVAFLTNATLTERSRKSDEAARWWPTNASGHIVLTGTPWE